MNTQFVNTARPAPYAPGAPQQPLANGMMPPNQFGAQQNYGSLPQKQQFGQQPPYATQPQPYTQQPYGALPQPYNTAPTYGQPPMTQPQFGAPPPIPQPSAFGTQQYPPQSNYSTGFQQAGGPMPMGGMGSAPTMGAGGPMGSMGAPMMGGGGYMGGMGGTVSLVKGGNMSLTKAVPNLRQVKVGLGWDVRQTPGAPFDLDASVFLLKGDGRVRMAQDLIFYNNRQSIDGSVFHHGDNLTGVGEGDDEQISVDLSRVPPEIQRIVCVVSIYEAEQRMQNFGMVSRAFIRVVNSENNQEIVRFDLTEEASMFNCMVFGELYRYNGEWKFKAIGQGVPGGLKACGPMFGLSMA